MAAHTNDKSLLGDGLQWNVRSYMLERRIDFSALDSLDTSKFYEIGTLPKGFVPRNIALVQLTGVDTASTIKLFKTVESADSGTATELASLTATATGAPATVFKPFDAGVVASTAATVTPSMDAQLAVKVGAAFKKGVVKVVVSGDWMTGYFDAALDGGTDFDPADRVRANTVS